MIRKISVAMVALLLASALTVTSFGPAEAAGGRKAAAIIGGAALGILAIEAMKADREYVREGCYRGRRECRWVHGECYYNDYGDRVCRGGHRECYRPVVCD